MDKPDHVLIVDEDRGVREFVAAYLEKNGMRVTLASSEIMPANRPFSQVRCSDVNGADSGISDGMGGRGVTLIPAPAEPWI